MIFGFTSAGTLPGACHAAFVRMGWSWRCPEVRFCTGPRQFFEKSGFTPLESPLRAAGMKGILFSANPVRALSLNGANTGFNALSKPSR
jgi:hypothetical protein